MRALARMLSVCLLTVSSLVAGESLALTGQAVGNSGFPNLGHANSVRAEFYLHDWTTQPTANVLNGHSIGIVGTLYNVGQASGPPQMYLAIFSPWSIYEGNNPGMIVSLDALFPETKAAYVRVQRDVGGGMFDVEIWDYQGNRVFSQQSRLGSDIADDSTGISLGTICDMAFFRLHSTVVPMNSRPPVTVDNDNRTLEWKFDGDLSDASGNGYWASTGGAAEPAYVATPHQDVVVAFPKTQGAPTWANWVSMRAGFPNMLDGTQSYSQSDNSAAVTWEWSQVSSGPSTLMWDDQTLAQPTVTGVVFGTYTFQLTVTDTRDLQGTATLDVGAVAMDDNGVVINSDPVVDQIFGPMIAYGKNPWGYADYLAMKATTSRYNDYLSYGLSPTWPYASWEQPLPGTVTYTWNGTGMSYAGRPGTKTSSAIDAWSTAPFTVADITQLDVSDLPTRVYVTSGGGWEEMRICSVSGSTLFPCYDGRGWADPNNSRIAAQAWPSGSYIGQYKVKGSGTSFLSTLCPSGAPGQVGLVAESTGSITLLPGTQAGVGEGTAWTSAMAGGYVRVTATHGGQNFVFVALVSQVIDAAHLTLSRPYPADADAGSFSYSIAMTGLWPVLHYTRSDGSDAMQYWPAFGCESDTSLYIYPQWDIPGYDGGTFSAANYTYMNGNWWLSFGANGGLDFYGEDVAHRALYYRSGYNLALTAANMIGDMWVRMPEIGGRLVYAPLFSGGLAVGGFADAMLSQTAHKTLWPDLRGFASDGAGLMQQPCWIGDSRDTGYPLAWLALAALYDPDTTSTAAPGGIPWQTYWRNQLPAMYTRELGCQGADSSWASGFYWNPYGDQVTFTNGSPVGTGSNISSGTCAGVAAGSGTATNGSGVIDGSGFISGTRIAITGTRSGQPFTMWQYYTENSATQITLAQGATWQGDTGPINWIVDNTSYFLTFMQSNADPMGAEEWSCIRNSPTQITLNRAWDGPSGTYNGYAGNVAGIAVQPYMLGIRQAAWRWAALAANAMGDTDLAQEFNSLRYAAGSWVRNTGFDSGVTHGMFYSRVQAGCEPITPASMGYGGGGPCFDDSPSNTDYDFVAMRELSAEATPSLWSYYDSGAPDRIQWGDTAYGSLWGWAPDTAAKAYIPTDQLTEQDPRFGASYGLDNGKWTGFFFGMGMAHQWPAIRQGGAQAPDLVLTDVPFHLPAGATQVQVTVTAPTGMEGTPFICINSCTATLDARLGSYAAHLVYQDGAGKPISTADELVAAACVMCRRR